METSIFIPLRKKGDSIIPPSRKSSYSPWNGLEGGKKVAGDRENMQSTRLG